MAGSLLPEPKQQFLNDIGVPLFGGNIFTYAAGTLTPKATYQDQALTIANTNPVIANARGEVVMYGSGSYRIILQDLFGNTIYDRDNISTYDEFSDLLRSDLASSLGTSIIGYIQAGLGAVRLSAQDKLRESVSVKDFGAIGDGAADDTAAIEKAIAAAKPNQAVLLCGVHRCLRKLQITRETAFVGTDPRNANLPDYNNSSSCLLFANPADGGIIGDFNVSLSNLVVISFADFAVRLVDGSLMTNNVLIQGGVSASVSILRGYYNKFVNTRLEYSEGTGAIFSNCYNISASNLSIRGVQNNIALLDASTMTMSGGSLEDFSSLGYGVTLRAGSSINFFGTYFEGKVLGGVGGRCVSMGPNSQVSAIGCHVYMSTIAEWITVEDAMSVGCRVFSRNNNLVWPTDSFSTVAYNMLNIDSAGSCDISGDNWPNQQGGVPGPNSKYLGARFTTGTGPVQNVGSYSVVYPPGSPFFGQNVNTRPISANTSNTTPGTPQPGMVVNYANNGTPGDDPLGLHLGAYGYNSYQAVYQKSQWEKVGTRLDPQSDSVATTVVDLRTDFNALLAKIRANGLMP